MPEGESIFISFPADGSGIVIKVVSAVGKRNGAHKSEARRRAKSQPRGETSKRRLRDHRMEANFEDGAGETGQGSEEEK